MRQAQPKARMRLPLGSSKEKAPRRRQATERQSMSDTKKCRLIVDSCCDLPPEYLHQDGITMLNFPYIIDDETFYDDLFQTMTASEFYHAMRKGAEPKTAQLPITSMQEAFREAAESGIPAVYLSFTSGLSGSYDTAMIVRDQILEEFPDYELYIVDTLLPSLAEGLLVFEAIKQWRRGMSAAELASWAEEARYFVDCEFMVEDLDCLKRGGRIPSSVAVAGSALNVKPLLSVDVEGKLALTGVARGRKKGISQLAAYFEKNVSDNGRERYAFVGDSDAPKDAQKLKGLIQKNDESFLVFEGSIGPVIGSHVGPSMVAVTFWGHDRRENLSIADKIARKVKGE